MPYLGNDLYVAQPSYRNIDDISGSFNGSTTSFPLTVSGSAPVPFPINSNQCLISVAGVVQRPDDTGAEGFRISGANIIFSSAPGTGVDFFGVILAGADYVNVGANFPSGSAVAPSITFDTDLDTGIYNSAANQVSITTAGTERLRIDSAGQIESVSLGSSSSPSFSFTTDPNTGIYSPGADQVAISTGGSGRLFVDASGNVGVGLSSPAATFGKAGSVDANGILVTRGAINAHQTNAGIFQYNGNETTIRSYGATAGTGAIVFNTGGGGGSADTERLRITSAGLVGIGTSSPSSPLHIVGNSAGDFLKGGIRINDTNNSSDYFIGGTTSGGLQIATAPAGATRFVIDSSGRVGIGTSTPSHTLTVAGNIGSSGRGNTFGFALPDWRIYNSSSGNALVIDNYTTEALRVDSSNRLLVGTSSTSVGCRQVLEGSTGGVQAGIQILAANTSSPADNSALGAIYFADNTHASGLGICAEIFCRRDGGTWSASSKPTRLVFSTTADGASSPTERMRINSTGTHDLYGLNDTIYSRTNRGAGTSYVTFAGVHSATGTGTGTASCYIYSNGNIQNTNGSYTTLSDVKLKENIVDAGSQWSDLKAIQIRNWNFKAETGHETHRQIGPIAQELETVCPGLVFETPDRDEDGNDLGTTTKGVNQSVLYMKAVKALQEAMERIETLEAKVAALEAA